MSAKPREIFLSHASKDARIANRVVDALRVAGVEVWFAPRSLVPSQQWHDEIGRALARCDWFVLLVSPNAIASNWVKREYLHALNDPRFSSRIVPVIIKPCDPRDLSWTLTGIQHVSLVKDFDEGLDALLRTWNIRRGKPAKGVRKSRK